MVENDGIMTKCDHHNQAMMQIGRFELGRLTDVALMRHTNTVLGGCN